MLRIKNYRSDRPENCSNSGSHYFTLFEQISGQSDWWFLILSNSKLVASVSFQDTSRDRSNERDSYFSVIARKGLYFSSVCKLESIDHANVCTFGTLKKFSPLFDDFRVEIVPNSTHLQNSAPLIC